MSDVLWRRLRYFLTPQWDHYKALAPRMADKDVLEVGCATGFGAVMLAGQAKSVFAIDIDGEAIDFCRESWHLKGLEFGQLDILAAAGGGLHFDAVVMIEVLEHVADRSIALRNIRELLRSGGALYVSARNALADLRRNDLHDDEKTATEFAAELAAVFGSVSLYDYSLEKPQTDTTHVTPVVAVCVK